MATAISQNDLVGAQKMFGETLPETVSILTRAITGDGAGGQVESFTATMTVKGRIAPAPVVRDGEGVPSRRGKVGDRIDSRTTHILTLPAATAISAVDRVRVNNVTYEVTAVRSRSYEVVRRVDLRRLG